MSLKPLAVVAAAVLAFAAAIPETASAQSQGQTSTTGDGRSDQQRANSAGARPPIRLGMRRRQAAPPTPEEIKTASQALLTATSTSCEIGEAWLIGEAGDKPVYEVTCAAGGGYLAYATEPAVVSSCMELASAAAIERERDPNASSGQLCTMPANQDLLSAYTKLAQTAGVTCTVDQGILAGRNTQSGAITYEIGCADQTGYWIRQNTDGGWAKYACFDIVLQTGGRCRFTTPEELATSWTAAVAGSAAAACEPATERRRVGVDAQGKTVFELKCGSGDGYLVRVDPATDKVTQVHPCAQAANIAGGCTLTAAAPAAAPAPGGRP